jgi:hypothetical protein
MRGFLAGFFKVLPLYLIAVILAVGIFAICSRLSLIKEELRDINSIASAIRLIDPLTVNIAR